ncbi:MAG: hypothetical protein H6686_09610 [Fibrobacteria bacterium]|nr:hypothetical protein [Fibrobacteria bacterium]
MDVETRLRELLLPVFALEDVEEIRPDASLVADLGADSLDFVEIVYLVEQEYGVQLATKTLFLGGAEVKVEEFFQEGVLASDRVEELRTRAPSHAERIREGMTRAELFGLITVHDLALVVEARLGSRAS